METTKEAAAALPNGSSGVTEHFNTPTGTVPRRRKQLGAEMSDGFSILVTWPQIRENRHEQETWYAHIPQQTEAVKAVQNACGALNDAKVEILNALSHASLNELGIAEGHVQKDRDLD